MDAGMRKYGEAAIFNFAVYAIDGIDLNGTWVPVQADCEIMKNEGTSVAVTATATDEGTTFSIALSATEMECARGVIKVQDAATKVILDTVIFFTTYGHASAEHAFDLDTSSVAQTGDSFARIGAAGASLTGITGAALSTAGILAIWHQLESAVVTASTMGLKIKTNLDAAITTATTAVGFATPTNITAATGITLTPTTGLGAQTANITGSVSSVTGSVDSVTGDTKQTGDSYALLNSADSEPAQGAPVHTASLAVKIATIFKFMVNKKTATTTEIDVFNSDESTVDHKSTISEAAGTYTEGEYVSGP